MPSRSTRGRVKSWWLPAALFLIVAISECLILKYTILDQANEPATTKDASQEHQSRGNGQRFAVTIQAAESIALIFVFKNLRFVDRYHDTLNAISTLAVAVFTATLWSTTRKLWEAGETQRALSESVADEQARSTKIAIAHAETAAIAAAESNRLTRNIFTAEQRPWIDFEVSWREDEPIQFSVYDGTIVVRIDVIARNVGKSPATNVSIAFGNPCIDTEVKENLQIIRNMASFARATANNSVFFPDKPYSFDRQLMIEGSLAEKMHRGKGLQYASFFVGYNYRSNETGPDYETVRTFNFWIGNPGELLPRNASEAGDKPFSIELTSEIVT